MEKRNDIWFKWPAFHFGWRSTNKKKEKKNMWNDLKPIDLSKIKIVDFPKEHYFQEEWPKRQIVLHHTVSGPGIRGDVNTWLGTTKRIGTCIIVERDGTPQQCFSSRFWAGHLGARRLKLDRESIGIELDNWGGLVLGDGTIREFAPGIDGKRRKVITYPGKFYAAYGNVVNVPVTHYPNGFRGYYYYEKYPDEQIRTVGELILFWRDRYEIPMGYNQDMWDVSQKALSGEGGIWSHTSYRGPSEKQDCHPQPELIEMLKMLEGL